MQSKPTAGNQNERAYSWRMQSAPRLVIERIHIHLQKSELPCWGRKSPAAPENKQHKTAGGERVARLVDGHVSCRKQSPKTAEA